MNQGERRPGMSSARAAVDASTGDHVARSRVVSRLLVLSGLLMVIGLLLDVLWGNPVFVVLGERAIYSGSVGSLVVFVGVLLLLGTGIAAAVRAAR